MALQRADWTFAAVPHSVTQARAEVAQRLEGVRPETLDVVLLLTSELVTNAVRHVGGQVGLHLTWDGRRVRVEVEDQSSDPPVVKSADQQALSGRGLLIVDTLAGHWGVEPRGSGKKVWFTLDT